MDKITRRAFKGNWYFFFLVSLFGIVIPAVILCAIKRNRSGGRGVSSENGCGFRVEVCRSSGCEKVESVLFSTVQGGQNSPYILPETLPFFTTHALGHDAIHDASSDFPLGQIIGGLKTGVVEKSEISQPLFLQSFRHCCGQTSRLGVRAFGEEFLFEFFKFALCSLGIRLCPPMPGFENTLGDIQHSLAVVGDCFVCRFGDQFQIANQMCPAKLNCYRSGLGEFRVGTEEVRADNSAAIGPEHCFQYG